MVNDARADGGRCPRCGARCGCGGVAVLATHRCARGARHSLARPPRLCALSARLPPLAQMAARSGRKRLRARRGGFAAPPLLPLAPAPASVCAASSGGWGLLAPSGGCAAAAPPPPPPVKCWGRGLWLSCVRCGGVAPAAAGAKKTAPCGAVLLATQYIALCYLTAVFLLSHLVTQSAQEMSPVMFRQVRPMSNRRSTP